MFRKPFRVKSNTVIKGSDRKKLRSEFRRQFPNVSEHVLSTIFCAKEDMTVMKICTHNMEDILVYTLHKNPVLFNVENVLYPTVYLAWKFPDLIPMLTTWPAVYKKLTDGADLMLPGVIVPGTPTPTALGVFAKNQACAINLLGNRAAVAVGKTSLSSADMYEAAMRGKGVIVLHTYCDHLWAAGDKSELPIISDAKVTQFDGTSPALRGELDSVESVTELMTACLKTSDMVDSSQLHFANGMDDELKREHLNGDLPDGAAVEFDCTTVHVNSEGESEEVKADEPEAKCNIEEEREEEARRNEISRESMDELLYQCFLSAIKSTAKRAELPLLVSTLYRNFMVPCCPSGSSLDVKKSSYKRLSKFLSAMECRGLIEVKELSKGVESIVSVNHEHEEFRSFRLPDWLPTAPPTSEVNKTVSGEPGLNYSPPTVLDMYQVTTAVLPLMKNRRKGDALSAQEVRQHITDYVKACNLQVPSNKGFVTLDATICDALVARSEYLEVLRWEDLVDRCLKKMTTCHQVTFPGSQPQVRRGHLEPIKLDVVQRGSNKKMTSVYNLEEFGIDPEQFAQTVQKSVACSSTVCPRTDKPKSAQVLVQGNQIVYIGKLLCDRYGLPAKFIRGLEKAPKKRN